MFRRNASFKTAGVTTEQIVSTKPCWVFGLYPELLTTGTIILRDQKTAAGGTATHTCAIGLPQVGKTWSPGGIFFGAGLTIQISVATDLTVVTYQPVVS